MKYILKKENIIVSYDVKTATSFTDRLVGLMFKKHMGPYDCLYIPKCKSIHTCFMKFPIDVVFVDKNLKVLRLVKNLKPWRFTNVFIAAYGVLELKPGSIEKHDLALGKDLRLERVNG